MNAEAKQETTEHKASAKEKALIIGIVICAIVAVAAIFVNFANAVPGDAAAKVGDSYITEQRVADWISDYRGTYGYTDDEAFADALNSQNQTITAFRINVIDQIATNDLVQKRANELGISVSDDEVQQQYDSVVESVSSGDSSLFQQVIGSMGLTEESLKERYRNNLLQEKVVEADVQVETPTDDEVLDYAISNLSGTTQMHLYRIVFSGTDKNTKAQECASILKSEKEAGTLTTNRFIEIAKQYSDEENVATTGGSLGWTGSGLIPDEISDFLENIAVGDYTGTVTVEEDGDALEIAYVDSSYTFPEDSDVASLSELGMPSDLSEVVSSATALAIWQTNCNNYLANLLVKAHVTYYPMPENAAYNVTKS